MRPQRLLGAVPIVGLAVALVLLVPARPAHADPHDSLPVASATTVGLHNSYEQGAFDYLAQALDTGTSLIELDVWTETFTTQWKVSHGNPFGNDNNCVVANSPSDLYTGERNKNLENCLDDLRVWHSAHPSHGLITVKIELKAGFQADNSMGPAQLDSLIRTHLGSLVYRPADLLTKSDGTTYATLDAAAKANNWRTRAELAGHVMVEVIPGTVEEDDPFDDLHTDVEYAQYLRNLNAAGGVSNAQIFPTVHGAASGDPRGKYSDPSIRPWFVNFDGDAAAWVAVDTSWFDTNHYLLVMTDAHKVAPAIDQTNPTVAQAQARVTELAVKHATIVSCDWVSLTSVIPMVLGRGTGTVSPV